MGIELPRNALVETLEEAIDLARSDAALPRLWLTRVTRLGELGIKTYVAALGAALLAKATDPRVDSLTQDVAAGTRGYSLRKVAEIMAERNQGRFHMGATGRWPLNNRPFLGGPSRIDEFTKISSKARPSFELFRDCLVDLNRATREQALSALAAWVQIRVAVLETERAAWRESLEIEAGLSPDELLGVLEIFVREDTENGRRGQALVAAVLDCAHGNVVLQSINHPHPGDVQIWRDEAMTCVIEVKQVPVTEMAGTELASATRGLGASLALLVVLAGRHAPLDRERLRRQAIADHGVLLEVAESVRELVSAVAVYSATPVEIVADHLPRSYAARLREHEVSAQGQQRWRQLISRRERDPL